jgi:hypothetical protein
LLFEGVTVTANVPGAGMVLWTPSHQLERPMTRSLLVCGLVLALGGCQPAATFDSPPPPTDDPNAPETLGIHYAGWPSVTGKPHPVAPVVFFMCAAPNPEQVEHEERERKVHGPHYQAAIVVRVSPVGREDFMAGRLVPVGTVVVKEKHWNERSDTPSAVAVMIKREPGYDPEHGDWEYGYEERSQTEKRRVVRGKLDSCIDCHSNARERDYLFRSYLKGGKEK